MKSKLIRPPGLMLKTGVMAFFAMTLTWLPQANATTAGAIIENVATVDWEDSSGGTYSDDDYTQVTVNLVAAAATISGRPIVGVPGDTAGLPIAQTVLSGTSATYLYALTANSNGLDTYNFRTPTTGIGAVTNEGGTGSVVWNLVDAAGANPGANNPATVDLGAMVVAVDPVAADTLTFPGGSLPAGIAVGDIYVIGGVDFRIAAAGITAGTAPDHAGPTPEVVATVQFEANPDGSNQAPNFVVDGIVAGDVVGQQQLFQVVVSATVDTPPANATVEHDVLIDTAASTNETNIAAITTQFEPLPVVTIAKGVRNVTAGDVAFTATSTGNPGDVLEYQLIVSNTGSTAEAVIVNDPIPDYTVLQTFLPGTGYGGAALGDGSGANTDLFATIDDGTNPVVSLTYGDNDEDVDVGSGRATGTEPPGVLYFYVGGETINPSGNQVGGDVVNGASYTILYRVRINPVNP